MTAKLSNYYEILGVDKQSSKLHIHVSFLRLMRGVIKANQRQSSPNAQELIQTMSIAHDILMNTTAKAIYDLSLEPHNQSEEQAVTVAEIQDDGNPHIPIGELLKLSGVLQDNELTIALDMHKALPEMRFGQFLVTSKFLKQEELDSALLGQKLISQGEISLNQFMTAMQCLKQGKSNLFDLLAEKIDLEKSQENNSP